jgi:hypothetical protein
MKLLLQAKFSRTEGLTYLNCTFSYEDSSPVECYAVSGNKLLMF